LKLYYIRLGDFRNVRVEKETIGFTYKE